MFAITVGLAVVATACGGSSTTEAANPTAADGGSVVAPTPAAEDVPSDAQAVEQPTTAPEADTEPAPDGDTTAPEASGGTTLDIVFTDGRQWTMPAGRCSINPEAVFPSALLDMVGIGENGVELNVIETWPLDGSTDRGTSFIASFVDDTGELYVLEAAQATGSDGDVSLTTNVHSNVFYAIGDAPDAVGTFACHP